MKIGRNDPCPCGSGKKYKKCCALVVAAPSVPPVAEPAPADDVAPAPAPAVQRGGRNWVPLQHQDENLRPNRFGRKKPF